MEILSRAMARLRLEVSPEDLALLGGRGRPDLSVTDRKNRLFRLRARLRDCLRQEILPSVDRAEDVGLGDPGAVRGFFVEISETSARRFLR